MPTVPPTGTNPTPPSMPTGPQTNPGPTAPLPVPPYWKDKPPLPASWNSDVTAAKLLAIQKPVVDRLSALDAQAAVIEQERVFLHNWLRSIPGPLPN